MDSAEQEFAKLKELMADKSLDQPLFSPNTGRAILSIAQEVLGGEIAAAKKNYDEARGASRASHPAGRRAGLHRARQSSTIRRDSPWERYLLEAKRPAEAETVYWEDLRRNKDNGWALFGLMQALKAQGKE